MGSFNVVTCWQAFRRPDEFEFKNGPSIPAAANISRKAARALAPQERVDL